MLRTPVSYYMVYFSRFRFQRINIKVVYYLKLETAKVDYVCDQSFTTKYNCNEYNKF